MPGEVLQPSGDAEAVRLAIAYDIAWTCGKVKGDPERAAALVGRLARTLRKSAR